MKYGIVEPNPKATKRYKTVVGVVGGAVGLAALGLGIFVATQMSLPIIGGLLMFGVVPADIVLTTVAVNNAKVETVREEFVSHTYERDGKLYRSGFMAIVDAIVENIPEHVIAEKINGKYVYLNPANDPERIAESSPVQFDSIKPMVHDDNQNLNNGKFRSRVIPFNKTKK